MQRLAVSICVTAGLLAATSVHSQSYPSRPIRIVVPFAAGGPADITARNIAPRMTELLGQAIIVDNRGGANGIIGTENVVKSPPDGYTLLLSTATITAINVVVYPKLPYNTLRDLQPLTPIMTTSTLLVVHPSLPVKSVKELVTLAKSRPGQIALGSAGNGGILHLPIEMLNTQAGITLTHVPYKGAAPAVIEVVAGQVQGMFVDLPVILPHVKAAKVRAIAVASAQRSAYLADVPTMKESGYPGIEVSNYYSLLLPLKTPRDIVMKLHEAAVKTVATPSVRDKLVGVGADPLTMSPEEFTSYIRADIDKWAKVVKAAGIKLDL
jgi:tripartite-type tricarboxylate transporter receptor subunit TctC